MINDAHCKTNNRPLQLATISSKRTSNKSSLLNCSKSPSLIEQMLSLLNCKPQPRIVILFASSTRGNAKLHWKSPNNKLPENLPYVICCFLLANNKTVKVDTLDEIVNRLQASNGPILVNVQISKCFSPSSNSLHNRPLLSI